MTLSGFSGLSRVLQIVAAALLAATVCSRSAAQERAAYPTSTRNVIRRAPAAAPQHPLAPTSEPAAGATADGAIGPHRKSWKELAHAKTDGKPDTPIATLSPWSAAGALAVVVGLILVLARLFRRHAPMFSQSLPQEALEILGRRFVDSRQTILLIRIGARVLVVASSANGLTSLGQIDDPVEVDLLAGMCRRGSNSGTIGASFFKLLKGEAHAQRASASVRTSPPLQHAVGHAARAPLARAEPETQTFELPSEGLSPPEYDLMRRLRGASAPLRAGRTEDAE